MTNVIYNLNGHVLGSPEDWFDQEMYYYTANEVITSDDDADGVVLNGLFMVELARQLEMEEQFWKEGMRGA